MIRDDSMFQDCDDQESFAEVCPPKSTSPSAGQVTYPSLFQELTDMTLWCKEFPAFSQIICDKCARCQNLCLLCQPEEAMQIKGDDLPHLKAASLSPGKRKSSESGDVSAAPTSSPKVNSPPKSFPEANLGVDMLALLARPGTLYVRTRLYPYMQSFYPYICKLHILPFQLS